MVSVSVISHEEKLLPQCFSANDQMTCKFRLIVIKSYYRHYRTLTNQNEWWPTFLYSTSSSGAGFYRDPWFWLTVSEALDCMPSDSQPADYSVSSRTMSSNNSQPPILENTLERRTLSVKIAESAVLVAINMLTLLGNSIVCAVVYRRAVLRTIANMFIVALAVTDILMALTVMPMSLGAQIVGYWPFGELACQIQGFSLYLLTFQSLQIITLTVINRNIYVTRSALHKRIFTRRITLAVILCTVLLSAVVVGSLTLSLSTRFGFHPGKVFCSVLLPTLALSYQFTIVFAIFFVVLPAIVITICYVRILATVRRNNREFERCRGRHDSRSILSRKEGKITWIILVIILGFALCWLPCVAIDVIDTNRMYYLPRQVYLFYTYLGYTSAMISPWIYGGMDKLVRKEMCSLCRGWNVN